MRRSFVIVRPDGHPRLCREASIPDSLVPLQAVALDARAELQSRLHADQTNAFRLFHATVEGHPGLTTDRYGALLLVRCFHSPLARIGNPMGFREAWLMPGAAIRQSST